MENLVRCPACHESPKVTVENDLTVVLSCPRHGHQAQGSSLDQATAHWNQYISYVKAVAA